MIIPSAGPNKVTTNEFKPSSYTGDKSVGTTAASDALATGAIKVQIKVTHATQNIRVGFGVTAAEAETNSASGMVYAIGDGIVEIGVPGSAKFIGYVGSGATTTFVLIQGA